MNKTISSDNLKDAVRKWHAKRKKDSNNQTSSENTTLESEGTVSTKKHDIRHITTLNHNNSIEPNQLSHANEQKRPRSTVIENNIKYIFDGPLSFDTIMALKKKKSNITFDNSEKILINSPNIEQNVTKGTTALYCTHQTNNSPLIENFKDEVNIIYSKSIDVIQNFFKGNSILEVINLLEYVLNFLSFSIQELISRYTKIYNIGRSEKSLSACINFILHKSNLKDDQFDEISLEFLAKYPEVFESLKTLTKIEELGDATPSEISDHILKFNSQIDKIYNLLLNR
ncbi:uncharacterized protein ELE39_001971 [Cryptosporidium sp. chipmunk genotype I]|uniref:uncharacterized protein n=1 Tax=Cryptosporidium sp. chipmunk genotype I TaxID=1280935 RepID=UPI00351A6203|nr:hypothetical protein ELE39_001971 [Cryptosporidium sp. chipmunk genotype I]